MAEAISLPVAGLSDEGVAEALAQHMENFVRDMGLPFRFQEVGGRTEDFPDIAKDAINDPITVGNPRPLTSVTDVLDLLWQAWSVRE
jgi:alcohol dehydrogenase class IV